MKKKRKFQVLAFEENHYHAELLKKSLESDSGLFHLTFTSNPAEGLLLLKRKKFDLILTDSDSDNNNRNWLPLLKKRNPLIPLVVLTSKGDERKAVSAMKEGADDYIIKNKAGLEKLPRLVLAALRKKKENKRAISNSPLQGIKGIVQNLRSLKRVIDKPSQSFEKGKSYYQKQINLLESEIRNLTDTMKNWF